jgi:hypothetical protein
MAKNSNLTISKFERYERNGYSEASIYVDGQCVGWITGCVSKFGGLLSPRFVITSYDVDISVDGQELRSSFPTRGEATAYVRSVFA